MRACVICGDEFNAPRRYYCDKSSCKQKYYWKLHKKNDELRRSNPERREQLRCAGRKHNQKLERKLSQQNRDLKRSSQMPVGNGEKKAFKILKKLFPDSKILCHRRVFYTENGILLDLRRGLRMNLEVDFFIPDVKLGIEIDGPHHFMTLKHHPEIKQLDLLKNELFKKQRLDLVRFKEDELYESIFIERLNKHVKTE